MGTSSVADLEWLRCPCRNVEPRLAGQMIVFKCIRPPGKRNGTRDEVEVRRVKAMMDGDAVFGPSQLQIGSLREICMKARMRWLIDVAK